MPKHKYIETPEKMWELFLSYSKKTKENPFKIKDWVGKDGDEVFRPKEKPLTMVGFENHCFIEQNIISIDQYFTNKDKAYGEYVYICHAIRGCIQQDQIEGGMAGLYNPSITQRLNGLVEKQQTEINGEGLQITIIEKTRET